MDGEPVELLREYGHTVLYRWRYERCHMQRQATCQVLQLADGRYVARLPRSDRGTAWANLDDALRQAQADREAYHAEQVANPYHGPGRAVGEWLEKTPYP